MSLSHFQKDYDALLDILYNDIACLDSHNDNENDHQLVELL